MQGSAQAIEALNVAVIGLGVGSGHAANYMKCPRSRLVAICDISKEWLEHCRQAWKVPKAYDDYQELLADEEIDAVSVCLPNYLHCPVSVTALEAGKHVLCEKPPAANAEEVKQMIAAARQANRTLMFSFNQRFTPEAQFLKRHIADGGLGDIYFARTCWLRPMGMLPPPVMHRPTGSYDRNWFNERAKGGGVMRDLGSHVIDRALWFMGFPTVARVHGNAYCRFGPAFAAAKGVTFDADDHSVGFVQFADGAAMSVEASFGSFVEKETIITELYGDKGGAVLGEGVRLFGSAGQGFVTSSLNRCEGPVENAQEHFVKSLLEGTAPIVLPEHGLAVMQVIDGIYAAAGWT
jgi:predicted dehydrogenase